MRGAPDLLTPVTPRSIPPAAGELRAFLIVRNELVRLPHVLAHHRRLGVQRFLVVDNGSTDGTAVYALAQPDVHVFSTHAGYQAAHLGIDWLEWLLDRYGLDGWSLVLDADEQLVYPGWDRQPLPALCQALDALGRNCLVTTFIDLYADAPIAATRVAPGQTLLECCPYFDGTGYVSLPLRGCPLPRVFGGARARLFWPDVDPARQQAAMLAAARAAFDEGGYLALHDDVAAAVGAGVVASGWDHFCAYGSQEGRRVVVRPVPDWPDRAYAAAHPDVREAVARGALSSTLEHYVRFGQFEGRLLDDWPPCLSQVPLVRWQPSLSLQPGRHGLLGARWPNGHIAGGALLHFRLMADVAERARAAIETAPMDASGWTQENRRYHQRFAAAPQLTAMAPGVSMRYTGVDDLVALGLVAAVGMP